MKRPRDFVKKRVQRVKSTVETQQPTASAAQETPITANPAATAEAPVPPRIDTKIINSDNAHAAIWQEALETLQKDDPEKYQVLDKVYKNAYISKNDKASRLLELSESKPEYRSLWLRAKAAGPSVSTVRQVAMTIAGVDHHQTAPIVVAATFFVIDVSGLPPA